MAKAVPSVYVMISLYLLMINCFRIFFVSQSVWLDRLLRVEAAVHDKVSLGLYYPHLTHLDDTKVASFTGCDASNAFNCLNCILSVVLHKTVHP